MSKSTSMVSWMGNLWARTLRSTSRRRNARPVESLESRVLLATLVSPTKLTYQDKDGDNVEVAFSKPILNAGNVNAIFTFDTGPIAGNGTKQQLRSINLTGVAGVAGTTIITKAVRSAANGGDGFAAIGQIDATGIDISTVTIDGDLGRILAGDATTTTQGLGALTVHSMGRFGTFTGTTNLNSSVTGNLLSLKSKTDVKDARLQVSGQIGTVTIGGSLIGGNATESGFIIANSIGPVSILGDVTGGAGQSSGVVHSSGNLTSVTIGGSLTGGSGVNSGQIFSFGNMGAVKVTGNVQGGSQAQSGRIRSRGQLASVTIGGSLIGGAGSESGHILSESNMGAVKITGNVQGGSQAGSGSVQSLTSVASVTIGGSLIGGASDFTGAVRTDSAMGPLVVTGSIIGGTGIGSGYVYGNSGIASVTIGGSLIGGSGQSTGHIASAGVIGPVVISGDVRGGSFDSATPTGATGAILTNDSITSVTIGGSLIGGEGDHSGLLVSGLGFPAGIGAVKIGRDLRGGSGISSGRIQSAAALASVTIGGSLIGSSGQSSGQVFSSGTMGPVVITGDVRGGSFNATTEAQATGAVVSDASIASVTIGGSLIGGTGNRSGLLASGPGAGPLKDMGAVKISGDVRGGAGASSGRVQSRGKLASLTIGGSLIGSDGGFTGRVEADSDMGAVNIKGDLIGGGEGFGSGVIRAITKLASVTLGGSLIGGTAAFVSGVIQVTGELTTLTINGDIRGGSASGTDSLDKSGFVTASRISVLTLGGSLIAGVDDTSDTFLDNGAIRVARDIGSLTIKGNIIGNATNLALITASGQPTPVGTTDLAIGKLTVTGRVEHSLIHVGVTQIGTPANADAQIGPVIVGGDWIASDLVAGAIDGGNGFGNSGDAKMSGGVKDVATVFSKITSIVIGGQVLGTVAGGDHFGFVAENIGSFKVKGGTTTFPMLAGNGNDDFLVGLLGDLRVNEI